MTTISASELQKNFGKYQAKAQREPVTVTSYGRESVVIISADDFERYKAMDTRRAYHVSEAPDDILEALDEELERTKHIKATDLPEIKF